MIDMVTVTVRSGSGSSIRKRLRDRFCVQEILINIVLAKLLLLIKLYESSEKLMKHD